MTFGVFLPVGLNSTRKKKIILDPWCWDCVVHWKEKDAWDCIIGRKQKKAPNSRLCWCSYTCHYSGGAECSRSRTTFRKVLPFCLWSLASTQLFSITTLNRYSALKNSTIPQDCLRQVHGSDDQFPNRHNSGMRTCAGEVKLWTGGFYLGVPQLSREDKGLTQTHRNEKIFLKMLIALAGLWNRTLLEDSKQVQAFSCNFLLGERRGSQKWAKFMQKGLYDDLFHRLPDRRAPQVLWKAIIHFK